MVIVVADGDSLAPLVLQVQPSELQVIASNYSTPEHFQKNGITLAGVRYIFLSGMDRVLRAKKEKTGLHCMKTEKGTDSVACSFLRVEPCSMGQSLGKITRLDAPSTNTSLDDTI